MGHLQDWGKQRQHVGQHLRVAPVSGRKSSCANPNSVPGVTDGVTAEAFLINHFIELGDATENNSVLTSLVRVTHSGLQTGNALEQQVTLIERVVAEGHIHALCGHRTPRGGHCGISTPMFQPQGTQAQIIRHPYRSVSSPIRSVAASLPLTPICESQQASSDERLLNLSKLVMGQVHIADTLQGIGEQSQATPEHQSTRNSLYHLKSRQLNHQKTKHIN